MTDWQRIIFDLKRAGFSEDKIAKKIGWNKTSLNRLKNGTHEPRYSLGQSLLDLHERMTNAGLIRSASKELG